MKMAIFRFKNIMAILVFKFRTRFVIKMPEKHLDNIFANTQRDKSCNTEQTLLFKPDGTVRLAAAAVGAQHDNSRHAKV
jgi:hypothetical protein